MRNVAQRMEEIRRRSEKVLSARRKRWGRFWAVCGVLALCLTGVLATKTYWPSALGQVLSTEGTEEVTLSPGSCPVEKIRISGNGVSVVLTEQSEILRVTSCLELLKWQNADSEYGGETGLPTGKGSVVPNTSDNESFVNGCWEGGFHITLILENGTGQFFRLFGDCLENVQSGQTVTLTSEQKKSLLTLLGLEVG